MIRIRILTKFETDIDEVNRLLEEGWEFEQIFRGINKEIYILHKYIQEEEDIRKEKRIKSIFTFIGKWVVLIFVFSLVITLTLYIKGEIPVKNKKAQEEL